MSLNYEDGWDDGIAQMRAVAAAQAKSLRHWSVETFPADANGQVRFARALMEGVADELDAAFNPPNEKAMPNKLEIELERWGQVVAITKASSNTKGRPAASNSALTPDFPSNCSKRRVTPLRNSAKSPRPISWRMWNNQSPRRKRFPPLSD